MGVLQGLTGLALCSLMLYWYLPASALTCANLCRSYSNAIAMRRAATRGTACKDATCIGDGLGRTIGRSLGAFLGMGLAALPGGSNAAAGCISGLSVLVLLPLAVPSFLAD